MARQMVYDGRFAGEKLGHKTLGMSHATIELVRKKAATHPLSVTESTMTNLYAYAADLDEALNTLADELFSDAPQVLRETVAAVRESVENVHAGNVVDIKDFVANRRKKRESRSAILTVAA